MNAQMHEYVAKLVAQHAIGIPAHPTTAEIILVLTQLANAAWTAGNHAGFLEGVSRIAEIESETEQE